MSIYTIAVITLLELVDPLREPQLHHLDTDVFVNAVTQDLNRQMISEHVRRFEVMEGNGTLWKFSANENN